MSRRSVVLALSVALFLVFAGCMGTAGETDLHVDRLQEAPSDATVLDAPHVRTHAPPLAAALEAAIQDGSSILEVQMEVDSALAYLREHVDDEAAEWTVSYQGVALRVRQAVP